MKLFRSFVIILSIIMLHNNVFSQKNPGRFFGGNNTDQGFSIDLNSDGSYIIAGTTRSFGKGSNDIYYAKIAPYGDLIWEKTIGWTNHDFGRWIEKTNDGGYILAGDVWNYGYGREDLYLLKINSEGDKEWDLRVGGENTDQGFCVKELAEGYIAVGYTLSFSETGMGDFYLVKTDKKGNVIWENNYGTEYIDYGFELIIANDGGYLLIGSAGGFFNSLRADYINPDSQVLLIKTDAFGNELWRKQYGGNLHDWGMAIHPSNDSGYYILGSTQSFGKGSFDMYLIKIDNEGRELWFKTFGGEDFEYGKSMDIDPEGNLYLLGTTNSLGNSGTPDIFIIKTDNKGEKIWHKTIEGSGSDYGLSIIATPDSGIALIGEFEIFESHEKDICFFKLDKNGGFLYINEIRPGNDRTTVVYPNPINNESIIEIKDDYPNYTFTIKIFDNSGKILFEEKVINSNIITIFEKDFYSGSYNYTIEVPYKPLLSGKFIVK